MFDRSNKFDKIDKISLNFTQSITVLATSEKTKKKDKMFSKTFSQTYQYTCFISLSLP